MGSHGATYRTMPAEAIAWAEEVLARVGAGAEAARLQAEHLVEAELRGHPSHGLRRLPMLVNRIRADLIAPNAHPRIEQTAAAALTVDGCRGFGPVVAYATIDAITERLDTTGVAVAGLRRTHHLGMLAPYVERLAERGYIGMVLSSTEGLVHPWGGSGALLGTNPLAIGVPSDGDPLVLDMSTGAVSAGKILDHLERGVPLRDGWAVDARGEPTRDPAAATDGAISPFGGAKGYALGLALGGIVGAVTGTAYGPEVRGTLDSEHETTKGDVIIAMDAAAFGQPAPSAGFGEYLMRIRDSGVDGQVAVPGDRARAKRDRAMTEGIDVTEEVWRFLNAEEVGRA